jgi:uncharacterized protein
LKVVVDTNVFVSGLLVPGGMSSQVIGQFRDGLWDFVVSGAILEEYGEVLGRPHFKLKREYVAQFLREVELRALSVIPSKRYLAVPGDPDDNEFVDVAMEAKADCIISGDKHLLSLKSFHEIPILPPAEFIEKGPY